MPTRELYLQQKKDTYYPVKSEGCETVDWPVVKMKDIFQCRSHEAYLFEISRCQTFARMYSEILTGAIK